jgi:[ribosomal protein S5]-alanine N-acetyltransferase
MEREIPKLETKRLILRPFKLSDADRVRKLAGDKKIADTTLNIPYPYEKGTAKEWISQHKTKFESDESVHLAIVLKTTREIIGAIGLHIEKRHNRAELGYWIGKDCWNFGYCTEAAKAIVKYGFEELNLNKIKSSHFSRNPASGKVMRKIGMKKEGFRKEHVKKWDKYEDLVQYAILRREWKNQKPPAS